ncbi:hypothetical protein ACHAWF_004943 [Thalassiosira exigua]
MRLSMALYSTRHHNAAPAEVNVETFEQHFIRYLRTFDGSKKDFSNVEVLFDVLYADNFYERKDGIFIPKDYLKQAHVQFFELGSKVTLTHFKRKSLDTIDIKYRMVNSEVDITVHQLITTKDGKIVQARGFDEAIDEERRCEAEIPRKVELQRDEFRC